MKIRIFQKGFNFSQDGPGNRLVYHMQGCGMRCPWCANPEGLSPKGGTEVEAEALLEEALRSRSMFFDGGGVTFTGGEPTLQFDVLAWLLQALHSHGVNTAIETNGSHPQLPALFPFIDHLMIDFKHPFPEKHLAITGVQLSAVMSNLQAACKAHPHVTVHIPLVNGYNASPQEVEVFASQLAQLGGPHVRVEPLWYHEYGRDKWQRLGLAYTVENGFLSDEQKAACLQTFIRHGIQTVRT